MIIISIHTYSVQRLQTHSINAWRCICSLMEHNRNPFFILHSLLQKQAIASLFCSISFMKTNYIYKIIKNNRGKFSFLVCFLRSNGGLSRRRSATAKFRYTFYGRSTPASFGDAISPLRRPPTAGAATAPMADPFPPLVVLLPPVAMVANHSRLKYLIFGGDPII